MKRTTEKNNHSFAWLNTTQFLGALNDNIFKLLVILFLIGAQGSAHASNVTSMTNAVFVVPFLLFLAFAGRFADRRSKRNVIVGCKVSELIIMAAAVIAFAAGWPLLLYAVFFCMAVQSTFFSPCKYGIIRELVTDNEVSKANGFIEAATFIAIIIGTAGAPLLYRAVSESYAAAAIICVAVAAAGLAASMKIKKTAPAGGRNKASLFFIKDIWRTLWSIQRKKALLWAVLGSAYFWLIGAVIYIALIPYGMEHLSLTKETSIYLYLLGALGIASGALPAGRLSDIALTPIGAAGMALSSLLLGLISPSLFWACVIIFLMGFSAGLFIVPVHTLIQLKSPKHRRSEIIAASSFLGWLAMLAASGVILLCGNIFNMTTPRILLLMGIFTLLISVIISVYLAEPLLRFLSMMLVRLIYRVKITGADNVPPAGGALIICNHVSYADAPLLDAACPRPVRFVMDRGFYNLLPLKPVCKLVRTIPIGAEETPKKIAASIKQARDVVKAGDVVCVFAEGAMTRNGNMFQFKAGFEKIIRGTGAPIIPAYIGGMWGSILSYYHGRPFSTFPKKLFRPVSVHFGKALTERTKSFDVRRRVQELSCDYYNSLKSPKRCLAYRFIKAARKNRHRRCIADTTPRQLTYGKTLIASLALAEKLKELSANNKRIGILLPPSVGAAIANYAVTLTGKVPVNLNYTLSPEANESIIEQCQIKYVISSAGFIEKFPKLKTMSELIFLEDINSKVSTADKLKAALKARFVPARFLARTKQHNCDDEAAVMFTSGSGGKPKGVMLSHHNIISNIDGMCSIFKLKRTDNLCAVLPFFHSFGFTCSLWLPVINGVSSVFVPNPLDGKLTGRAARENKSTVLFAAPTFLKNYIKRAEPGDFANLRLVMTGAEVLKKSVADSFEKKFGIRPQQGYGATELSPVVSFNLADVEFDPASQVSGKEGTVGHPIPGIAAKIVHPESRQALATNEEGLLMIKGPNVMSGYLNDEQKTRQALQDGWYSTGDIACIDADGFINITGRLTRFSKIAGEMVPHTTLEEKLHNLLNLDGHYLAVTGIPDEKKGEQLVVLYTPQAGDGDKLYDTVTNSDLPNIYKPRRQNYICIEEIPALGSGKLDLAKIKQIAVEFKSQNRLISEPSQSSNSVSTNC